MKSFKSIFLFLLLFAATLFLAAQEGPIKVEVRQGPDGYSLYRGGEPFYIKGVGGKIFLDKAQEIGANSIRTWAPDNALEVLDEAHARGLTVLMGLWVGQERQGFDYNDSKAVAAQLAQFTEVVKQVKDHPALLMWGIGNENDLMYSDFKVWYAINDIAKMIHEIDPNHPTMTVTAGIEPPEVALIKERAPHIDILGINTYGDLMRVDKQVRAYGWEGPYIITEWGPDGHWEVPKTEWGAPIEQTSGQKAEVYRMRYEKGIYADKGRCIGSYVFLWGNKQETTSTWYGVFLPDGQSTQVVDELHHLWKGEYPDNRAPIMESLLLEGQPVEASVVLRPNQKAKARAVVEDPDGDPIQPKWVLMMEATQTGTGGDFEVTPEALPMKVLSSSENEIEFRAPAKSGNYRLFFYGLDGNGHGATANFPFKVESPY